MASLVGGSGNDILTLTGSSDNTLNGMAGNDRLEGGNGNDRFDIDFGTLTGSAIGIDQMIGHDGDDVYYVDDTADQVIESLGEGIDTVISSVSYTLASNIENLTLDQSAETATGNDLNNTLIGNNSSNILNGGVGLDRMDGGSAGSDTFYVDNVGDVIVNVSTDVTNDKSAIVSTIAIDLTNALTPELAFISYVTLTGTNAVNVIGNALDNTIVGNSAVNFLNGNDGNDYLDGGGGADTMSGLDGEDTYYVDNVNDVINETIGTDQIFSSITLDLANYNLVESLTLTGTANLNGTANAVGSGITGNSGVNTLTGRGGDDILSGGLNSGSRGDTLIGGLGDDTFIVFNSNDVVRESGGQGNDTVVVLTSISLSSGQLATQEIENITLFGVDTALNATGNALNNNIIGNYLDNTLNGLAGADTMSGGDGDDTYIVDSSTDFVDEILNQGTDTVQSSVDYTLTTFVENLTLTGSALVGTGNLFDNTITGNNGNNTLDGGIGADTLIGGVGNDTYRVDNIGDVVSEAANQGLDTVESFVSYSLGANLENITLVGTLSVDATGNSLANVLTGNAGDNTLDGGGGVDIMIGAGGDDYYFVDATGDVTSEIAGQGNDTVESSVTYTLNTAAAAEIENLVLSGTANIDGTGNAAVNILTGNSSNNTLDGRGGNDTMIGGNGDDVFVVDASGDVVSENAGEGLDTVSSSATYDLSTAAAAGVENLTLTGAAAINATGNALNNTLTGNSGANVLTGNAGDDTYIVDASDTIVEGVGAGTDTAIFSGAAGQSFTLGGNIENLILGGTTAIDGTGDATDNTITGNIAVNTIDGGDGNDTLDGGGGADVMIGGIGNDTFIVNLSTDFISENAAEGNDTVVTNATFNLATNAANIENLVLSGTAAINGTGDGNVNIITGNTAKNVLSGLAGNDTLDGGAGADTLLGGDGNDLYFVDNTGDKVTETALVGVDTVNSTVSFTLGTNLENLVLSGTGDVNGTGNAVVNTLTGNTGDNTLNGLLGADTMIGGLGDDTYVIDDVGDIVTELFGQGTDTVTSLFDVNLAGFANVENLVLGGTAATNGTGNAGDNTLTGNSAVNVLTGGAGNDTYYVQSTDTVVEGVGGGNDTVYVTVKGAFTIWDNIENVFIIGSAGNITGNADVNTITGGTGNNTLDGQGGADIMAGGKGSDVYIVDDTSDIIFENAGEGTETVRASASYALSAYVEKLILTGTADINGTGNNLDNTITGNSGNNTLDGGSGTDKLVGGAGDDYYIVDTVRDALTDTQGNDTVQTGITYTLKNGFENLVLTGTADVDGTGNNADNTMTGNAGDNSLSGGSGQDVLAGNDGDDFLDGGAGADTMDGGDGDDTFVVDNANDLVIDGAGLGDDTLNVGVNYTLSATAEIETVNLTGTTGLRFTGSNTDNDITGNSGANSIDGAGGNDVILGGLGNDILDGGANDDELWGGAGHDVMTGGSGSDTFVFEVDTAFANSDTITDFDISTDNDKLDISDLLEDFDPLVNTLSDWVQIREGGGNSTLWVNTSGDGVNSHFTQIAILQGITGITGEQQLVDDGNLIIA